MQQQQKKVEAADSTNGSNESTRLKALMEQFRSQRQPIRVEVSDFASFVSVLMDYVGGSCLDVDADESRTSRPEVLVSSEMVVGLFDGDHPDRVVLNLTRSRQLDYLNTLWLRRQVGVGRKNSEQWLDELAYSLEVDGLSLLRAGIINGNSRRAVFPLNVPCWAFAPNTRRSFSVNVDVVLMREEGGLLSLTPVGSHLDQAQTQTAAIAHAMILEQLSHLDGGDSVRVIMGRPSVHSQPPQILEGCEIVR